MTYVIVLDGFKNQGWEYTYALFEPSFYADKIRIYFANNTHASSEIEELMPRDEKHNFIYLYMQRGEHPGSTDDKISHYRYKTTIEQIKKQFPYYREHNNIFLTLDHNQKILGSNEYKEKEKAIAFELDKKGYLDNNEAVKHLFSHTEVLDLDKDFVTYVKEVENENESSSNKKSVLDKIICKVTNLLSEKREINNDILYDILEEEFVSNLSKIKDIELTKEYAKPSYIFIRLLEKYISIKNDLNEFTVLQYGYTKDIDRELFLTVGSLLSLINNAKDRVYIPYWLEVSNLEIDLKRLKRHIEKIEWLEIEESLEDSYKLELNPTEDITLSLEVVEIEIPDRIEIPWFNSKREEEILSSEIEQQYNSVESTYANVKDNIAHMKRQIHNYHIEKKERVFSKDELHKSLEDKLALPQIKPINPLEKIMQKYKDFPLKDFMKSAIHELRKVPTFFRVMSVFLFVVLIYITPYIMLPGITLQVWNESVFPVSVVLVFFVATFVYLSIYRGVLRELIIKYETLSQNTLSDIRVWQKDTLNKQKELFLYKLSHENYEILNNKYTEIQEKEHEKLYHRNHVLNITHQVKEIKKFFSLTTNPEVNTFSIDDTGKSVKEIMNYALFDEKELVKELNIDVTMTVNDLKAYGIIDRLILRKIIDKET